jgi:hypothetical protein
VSRSAACESSASKGGSSNGGSPLLRTERSAFTKSARVGLCMTKGSVASKSQSRFSTQSLTVLTNSCALAALFSSACQSFCSW